MTLAQLNTVITRKLTANGLLATDVDILQLSVNGDGTVEAVVVIHGDQVAHRHWTEAP